MRVLRCVMLVLAFALGEMACAAQDMNRLRLSFYPPVSIARITTDTRNASDFHPASHATGTMILPVYPTSSPRHAVDLKFLLLNAIHAGMAVFDVEMTQHCISSHRCRETNPVMPSSQAGQLGVNFVIAGGVAGISYWARKSGSRLWWLPPVTGAAIHTAGVVSGFQHE